MCLTIEEQNKLWACLTEEERKDQKELYQNAECEFDNGANYLRVRLFGKHNLSGVTEPIEMIIVNKKQIEDLFKNNLSPNILISKLKKLLLNDNINSEENILKDIENYFLQYFQIKVGDKVKIIRGNNKGSIGIIYAINDDNYIIHFDTGINPNIICTIDDFEIYSEKITQKKLKPIHQKTVVYFSSNSEEKIFREILHKNGWKWHSGQSLIERSYYAHTKVYCLYPNNKTVKKDHYNNCKDNKISFINFMLQYMEISYPRKIDCAEDLLEMFKDEMPIKSITIDGVRFCLGDTVKLKDDLINLPKQYPEIYRINDIIKDKEKPGHFVVQLINNGKCTPYFQAECLEHFEIKYDINDKVS